MKSNTQANLENQLITEIEQFVDDPYGFVMFVFDWGRGELEGETGPDEWQTEILKLIGEKTLNTESALQIAVRSGHGIGKTALISWIELWFMSTRPHPAIVTTANTASQLETKTWRELAKWHKRAINSHWFTWTATKFYLNDEMETWFASAIPWSKQRAQAFAGTHEKHVLMLFDEASEIDDIIWETAEGAMTTEGAMWIVFGNPTMSTGRFAECFKKYRHRWITREIDSRTAKKANKKQIQEWIDDYGEDSDFVRVRVKGQEPRSGSMQFISAEDVGNALGKSIHISEYHTHPKILGCDVARFGDDQSVMCLRQGLAVLKIEKFRELDTMTYASKIAVMINEESVDAVFVDVGAMGAGVIDRLRQLGHDVFEIGFGCKASDELHYINKRSEMWGNMNDWLKSGGCIPDDNELRDDLIGPQYGFDARERIQLERKKDMKTRGLASPDIGDALALTFAESVNVEKLSRLHKTKTMQAEAWSPFDV